MTFSLDFRPRRDGQPYDPLTFGGGVNLVRVYTTPERTGTPIQTKGPAVRVSPGLYRFTLDDLPDATYYTLITWTEATGAVAVTDRNDRFTLPVPDPVIARLRRMVAEPNVEGAYTDDDLARYIDTYSDVLGTVDLNAAAADIWEEKASALAEREVDGRSVNSVRTGEQGIVYSTTTRSAVDLAERKARYYRARTNVRVVRVTAPGADPLLMRPEQYDAGLGHAYSPEARSLLGLD